MKCKNCPEGKHYMSGSAYCVLYGMIIRDEHECTREGGRRHERDADNSEEQRTGAEIRQGCIGIA